MHPQGRNGVEKLACKLAWVRAQARTEEPESIPGSATRGDLAVAQAAGRTRKVAAIVRRMETGADIIALWPRWMDSAGTMLRVNALARSRCSKCGTLLRVELEDVVARHGPGYLLVDKLERCRMVGCIGSTFYLASRTYGREWTMLLRDPALIASFETLPRVRTALG